MLRDGEKKSVSEVVTGVRAEAAGGTVEEGVVRAVAGGTVGCAAAAGVAARWPGPPQALIAIAHPTTAATPATSRRPRLVLPFIGSSSAPRLTRRARRAAQSHRCLRNLGLDRFRRTEIKNRSRDTATRRQVRVGLGLDIHRPCLLRPDGL